MQALCCAVLSCDALSCPKQYCAAVFRLCWAAFACCRPHGSDPGNVLLCTAVCCDVLHCTVMYCSISNTTAAVLHYLPLSAAGFMAVIQALVSVVADQGDSIQVILEHPVIEEAERSCVGSCQLLHLLHSKLQCKTSLATVCSTLLCLLQ